MRQGNTAHRRPLLHRYDVSKSGDADTFSSALTPLFGHTVVEPARGSRSFHAQFNICRLSRIAVGYARFEQPFHMKIAQATSFVHGFPIRGIGEHVNNGMAIQDSPLKGAVGAPGPMSLSYAADFEIFAAFLRPDALSKALAALTGAPPRFQLKLNASNYGLGPETPVIRRLVRLLIAELDGDGPDLSSTILTELEQAILVAFLCGVSHNYNAALEGRSLCVAPREVRRVEEYIEAHWSEPITILALAALTNASARSVFASFREHRGWSPMGFVKQVRLKHARAMLETPSPETSVASVAIACGFGNLGHFANDYRQVFGENPSATLTRNKR
jgi:AraC-like DNA-binding protein